MWSNLSKIIWCIKEFDKHHGFLAALCGHALWCSGHIAKIIIRWRFWASMKLCTLNLFFVLVFFCVLASISRWEYHSCFLKWTRLKALDSSSICIRLWNLETKQTFSSSKITLKYLRMRQDHWSQAGVFKSSGICHAKCGQGLDYFTWIKIKNE